MGADAADSLARLADVAERMLEREERRERTVRDEHLRERWGYRAPPRLALGAFFSAIPGLAALFERIVPDEFVAQVDHGRYEIACPCGEVPALGEQSLSSCQCGRWFLHDGRDVRIALGPKAP